MNIIVQSKRNENLLSQPVEALARKNLMHEVRRYLQEMVHDKVQIAAVSQLLDYRTKMFRLRCMVQQQNLSVSQLCTREEQERKE